VLPLLPDAAVSSRCKICFFAVSIDSTVLMCVHLGPQILEMAFSGNCGVAVDLPSPASDPHGPLAALFAEELGLVLEVAPENEAAVLAAYAAAGVPCAAIGTSSADASVTLAVGGTAAVSGTTPALRDVWEATSFQLERLQCAEENVEAEQAGLAARTAPQWRLPYTPTWTPEAKLAGSGGWL
jgi:phosphoribosylformylglycinamidine synthase